MKTDKWTKSLNQQQQQAVLHNDGPLLILAGAGSGKTTVLVRRTGRMIAEKVAKPDEIVVLTFTNKAARELKHRVGEFVGKESKGLWAGTFHSFGLKILRKYYKEAGLPKVFGVIDSTDARGIVRDLLKDIVVSDKESFDSEKILSLINKWRASGRIDAGIGDVYEEVATVLLPKFILRLKVLGVVDFDGLLLKPLELFESHPKILTHYQDKIKQLMVDEFQDTNDVQMKLIDKISSKYKNLTVVGDDDQAIYGWRGARVENILRFPHHHKGCKMVCLEENYRSTPAILDLANAIIEKNKNRHAKELRSALHNEPGEVPEVFVYEDNDEESESVQSHINYFLGQGYNYKDIAILYRSNSQGGLIEGIFRFHDIPYVLTGGSTFFERKEVKDVLAYLRCIVFPHEIALRRIFSTPSRGIGEKTIQKISDYAEVHDISFYKAAKRSHLLDLTDKMAYALQNVFKQLSDFKDSILSAGDEQTMGAVFLQFFEDIGYKNLMYKSYKDVATAHKRWTLVEVMGKIMQSYFDKHQISENSLRSFMESMELRDLLDENQGKESDDRVQMLTLHACKGLEFPVVILLGMEEDVLPHRTLGSDISEERRLFYVGVTRAKERLVLSRSLMRQRFGKKRPSAPSRFLLEVESQDLFKVYEEGCRPLSSTDRKDMLGNLYAKLNQQIKDKTNL